MKYLLLIVIVLAVLFIARAGRQRVANKPPPRAPDPATEDEPMLLACAQCGTHLPRGESLPGRGGVFCDEAHRAAYERAHPAS